MITAPLTSFEETVTYITRFIPKKAQFFPGDFGTKRTKVFLELLDNPQEKLKIIHIAGTSGKGSTAYLLSTLLKSQGFKTGLHVSPHLLDIRERFQINNELVSEELFCEHVRKLIPAIEKLSASDYGAPSYFELLVVLAFSIFHAQKVDYAVIETGLGGLYDATNVITRSDKLVLLTPIGKDHMNILGSTLPLIATQKAHIMQPCTTALSTNQKPSVKAVFQAIAQEKQASITFIEKYEVYKVQEITSDKSVFDFSYLGIHLESLELRLLGEHQIQNASLALAGLITLSTRDVWNLSIPLLRSALKTAVFPGRLERRTTSYGSLLLDGAHNPAKMRALTKALITMYPSQTFTFVVAFKKGKDITNTLRYIIPIADHIVVTKFFSTTQDNISLAVPPQDIVTLISKLGFDRISRIDNTKEAIVSAFTQPQPVVVTGSLYLLADVYTFIKDL